VNIRCESDCSSRHSGEQPAGLAPARRVLAGRAAVGLQLQSRRARRCAWLAPTGLTIADRGHRFRVTDGCRVAERGWRSTSSRFGTRGGDGSRPHEDDLIRRFGPVHIRPACLAGRLKVSSVAGSQRAMESLSMPPFDGGTWRQVVAGRFRVMKRRPVLNGVLMARPETIRGSSLVAKRIVHVWTSRRSLDQRRGCSEQRVLVPIGLCGVAAAVGEQPGEASPVTLRTPR